MVWKDGGSAPRYKHVSEASAIAEAERLAGCYPDQRFYVLTATRVAVTARPVEVRRLAELPS